MRQEAMTSWYKPSYGHLIAAIPLTNQSGLISTGPVVTEQGALGSKSGHKLRCCTCIAESCSPCFLSLRHLLHCSTAFITGSAVHCVELQQINDLFFSECSCIAMDYEYSFKSLMKFLFPSSSIHSSLPSHRKIVLTDSFPSHFFQLKMRQLFHYSLFARRTQIQSVTCAYSR